MTRKSMLFHVMTEAGWKTGFFCEISRIKNVNPRLFHCFLG